MECIAKCLAGSSANGKLDRKQILGDIFIKMDIGNSRSVNLKEYRGLFPSDSKAKAMQWVFKYLDKLENGGDFNGELSRDEWVSGMLEFGEDDSDEEWKAEMDGYVEALEEAVRAR